MRLLPAILILLLVSPAWATPKAPVSSGQVVDLSVTIGTTSTLVLPADNARGHLAIVNNSSTNSIACTKDGSIPVINGNGITLLPSGADTNDVFVPLGAITCIASGASTVINLEYTP